MLATIPASRGSTCHTLMLQLPMGDWCANVWMRENRSVPFSGSIVGPDPGEDLGHERAAVVVGMAAVAPVVFHLVPRAQLLVPVRRRIRIFERAHHLLIREEPVAVLVREVAGAVLQ